MPCPKCGHTCDERQNIIVEYMKEVMEAHDRNGEWAERRAVEELIREVRDGAHRSETKES